MQTRRNSSALATELRLVSIKLSVSFGELAAFALTIGYQ